MWHKHEQKKKASGKPDRNLRRSRRLKIWHRIISGLAVLVVAGLLTAFWTLGIEPDLLTVTRLTITDPTLPASWNNRVIAFFSDTHVGPSFDARRLARVSAAIEKAQPDLILFGGDLVDHRTPADAAFTSDISVCLARMRAPFGQYAIIGNHDNRLRAELNLAKKILADGGFQVLINKSVVLDGLWLGGLDESYFGSPNLNATYLAGTENSGLWKLLLMHQPDYGAALPADAARLILAGHTHNGQITIFGHPVTTVYQGKIYTYGRYALNEGRQLVVTRGLGTIALAARFCSPPELMLITLRRG